MKVKPKIIGAARALADAQNDIRVFHKEHGAGGRQVFSKKLDYFVGALSFNPETAIAGLDDEIKVVKSLMDKTNELRLATIKNA